MLGLVLLLAMAMAATAVPLDCARERIVNCTMQYLDGDGDGAITQSEWVAFIVYHPCARLLGAQPTWAQVAAECDADGNGILTEADYDHTGSYMSARMSRVTACALCDSCDIEMQQPQ